MAHDREGFWYIKPLKNEQYDNPFHTGYFVWDDREWECKDIKIQLYLFIWFYLKNRIEERMPKRIDVFAIMRIAERKGGISKSKNLYNELLSLLYDYSKERGVDFNEPQKKKLNNTKFRALIPEFIKTYYPTFELKLADKYPYIDEFR